MSLFFFLCYLILTVTLKSVNLIAVSSDVSMSRVENSKNLEQIKVPQNKKLINQLQTLPCIYTFVTRHMNQQPTRISVLLTDYQDPLSSAYVTFFQQIRSTYVLTESVNTSGEREHLLDIILILKNHKDLQNLKQSVWPRV